MKKIILLIAAVALLSNVKAMVSDSTKNNSKGVKSIEIALDSKRHDTTFIHDDTTVIKIGHLKIKVNPKNIQVSADSTKSKPKKPKNIQNNWLGLDLGLCNFQSVSEGIAQKNPNPPFNLRQSKSIDVKLYVIQQRINLVQHKLNFRWGLGVTWNNYRFNSNQNVNLFKDKTDGTLAMINDSVKFTKNKFVTKYLSVPLMLELKLGKKESWKAFRLAAGVEANLLLEAWQKQISGERGKQKRFEGDYNLTQLPLNYVVRLGVGKLNFYGTYAMTPMFNASQQSNHYMPKMYPWAFGIQLNGL